MYRNALIALFSLCCVSILSAQVKSGEQPLNGIYQTKTLKERLPLAEPPVREADVNWQKSTWSVIDTREKINLAFRYPERPLISILLEGLERGDIKAYSPEKDDFSIPMSYAEIDKDLNGVDTVRIIDHQTLEERFQVVTNLLNPDDIIHWRIKEVHFFDTRHSRMEVRTLGLAPVIREYDEMGELKYERPAFWVYLPHCRELLMQEPVFSAHNTKPVHSWDDIFQMRYYSSYIYQESDLRNRRLKDYLQGRDLLIKSMAIEQDIQNREQDAWSH